MMKKKKIYLNDKNYCEIELYTTQKEMQEAYFKRCPKDRKSKHVLGAHNAYECFIVPKKQQKNIKPMSFKEASKRFKLAPKTGTIFLSLQYCGAGVVTHEFMHAVLWAYKHKLGKKQYPIRIKSMEEEEKILKHFTFAVQDFYRWYWKITKNGKFKT